MGFKEFFKSVSEFLDMDLFNSDCFSKKNKIASVKKLIEKLENRKKKIKQEIKKASSNDKKKSLLHDLAIVNETIKKGNKYIKKHS